MKLELSELQRDALTEIVNIGVGRAANSLSDIIGEHIVLKVPNVKVFPLEQIPHLMSNFNQHNHAVVSQGFRGDFAGTSALLFPPESAGRLVSALTGESTDSPTLDEVRSGTLVEIGNIVINAILGTMGNMLDSNFIFSLPEFREIDDIKEILQFGVSQQERGFIMLAEANFHISTLEINGFILILFKLDSIQNLMEMIDQSISRLT